VARPEHVTIEAAGHEVRLSNPSKIYFPQTGFTKHDLVNYYLAAADAVLVHLRERPTVMKRFVNGIEQEPIWQKRVPRKIPDWLETATVSFPSGRTAEELCAMDAAHLVWANNLGVIDFNPWPARRQDIGYPKTSGSKGMHVNVRIEREWTFTEVRRAALALAREVERRTPLATSKWWKEERHGVFVDYNQNARDRTVASAYSVRPTPDARVSCPLEWDEVADVDPRALRLDTVPERLRSVGDPAGDIDANAGRLDALHALADRDEEGGLGDAPWPPHFAKQRGEPKRVQASRDRDRDRRQPTQRGRAGDPQPGGPPDPQYRRPHEPGKRRPPRTGQGYEEEFDEA
jgi:bifunctional non-homologous end joining protein LigD